MRFTRDQQDAKAVADPVDRQHNSVVSFGQLPLCGNNTNLQDIWTSMLQDQRKGQVGIGANGVVRRLSAIDRNPYRCVSGHSVRNGTLIFDPKVNADLFA